MLKAFGYCRSNLNKINGKINEIALIEVELNDDGIAIEDTAVFVKSLKGSARDN
jgi:hypothetical protein